MVGSGYFLTKEIAHFYVWPRKHKKKHEIGVMALFRLAIDERR